MKKILLLLICACSFSSALQAQNIILNPGCDDTLIDGEIPYWQEIMGDSWTRRAVDPDPFAGDGPLNRPLMAQRLLRVSRAFAAPVRAAAGTAPSAVPSPPRQAAAPAERLITRTKASDGRN